MSEEIMNTEVQQFENDKIEKIKIAVENLKNKKSKFLFFVPESQNPAASVYEVYFHATVIKKMGFEVIMLVEKAEYVIPSWIDSNLTEHKHMPMSDPKLTIAPDTIMIIPDVYSNIMEQTKDLPCLRIGLLQSIDYMINSLIPGMDWKSFGVNNVITTSEMMNEIVRQFYGNKFNVKSYKIGIPDYFKPSNEPQKPVISIVGRNPNEISKLVKLFYAKYPQYGWVSFDPMLTKSKPPQTMRRIDFANRLKNNFAAVWVDRIASFGTFPLECMKSGVIPICLKPDIMPEYMVERNEENVVTKVNNEAGVWTENFYDLPLLIGEIIVKFLDDNLSESIYDAMKQVSSSYNMENSEESIVKVYTEFINERITFFENAIPK